MTMIGYKIEHLFTIKKIHSNFCILILLWKKMVIAGLGSGALPGLYPVFFFIFLEPAWGSNPAGSYPNPFPNPAGKANLYLI